MIFTRAIKLLTVSWCPRIWTLPFHQVTIGAGRDPCTSHCRSYVWFADRARFLPGKLTSRGRTVERCEKEEKILQILLKSLSKDAKSLWQMPKFQDLAERTRAGSVCLPNGVWISSRICGSGWHSSSGGNLPGGGRLVNVHYAPVDEGVLSVTQLGGLLTEYEMDWVVLFFLLLFVNFQWNVMIQLRRGTNQSQASGQNWSLLIY